jgi:hypothetical protein
MMQIFVFEIFGEMEASVSMISLRIWVTISLYLSENSIKSSSFRERSIMKSRSDSFVGADIQKKKLIMIGSKDF